MKRQASRIFAFVLAVMMLVTSVPTTAFANEAQNFQKETNESAEEQIASSEESLEEMTEDMSQEETGESSEEEETSSEMIEEVSEEISFEETTFEEVTTEEETSICETEVVTETEMEVMSTETDNRSDEGTPTECVITFEKFGDVTIYDAEGVNEISSITVTYGSTETVSFLPVAGDGYTVQSAIASGSFKFVRNDQGIYVGKAKKNGITEDITVSIYVTEIAEYTVDFLNAEDVDGLQVMADGEVITLTDGRVAVSNDDRITFKLKAKEGTIVRTAYKLVGDEEDISEMEVYETDEEGYSYYVLGKVFENYIVTIYVEEACKINFETDKVTIQEVRLYDDESWYDPIGDVYDAVTVEKGKDFYFKVEKMYSYGSFFVSTDGTEKGKIDSYWNNDGITIYKITPDGDMTITVSLEPIGVDIITGELDDLSIIMNDDVSEIAPDKSAVYIYEPVSTEVSFMPLSDKFYSAYYTYSEQVENTDEEGNFIWEWVDRDEPIDLSKDEETGKYSFNVTLDYNIKSVTITSRQAYQINFTTSNACINRVVYDDAVGDWGVEEAGISSTQVAEGVTYYFAVKQEKGSTDYLTWFVSTDGTESGKLEPYANWYDGKIYKIKMEADMNITAKVLPKSVPVVYPEGMSVSASSSDENSVEFTEDFTFVNVYDNAEATFSFEAEVGKTYKAYYTYAGYEPVKDANGDEVYNDMSEIVYKKVEYTRGIELQAGEDNRYSFTIPMETSVKDIFITAGEAWPVHFEVTSPFGEYDITTYKVAMHQDGNGYFKESIVGETENVLKGESLYFCVERSNGDYVIPVVTVDGEKVQPYWTYGNNYVYKVTPEAEMNVSVSVTQRTVAVNAPELDDFTITSLTEGCNAAIAEDLKYIGMTGACEFLFKFIPVEGKQYSVYKNYTIKTPDYDENGNKQVDESGKVIYTSKSYEQKIYMEADENGYYAFRLRLDSNTTSVSITEAEHCMLSFSLDDKVSVKEVFLGDQECGIEEEEEIEEILYAGIGETVYLKVKAEGFSPDYISYEVSTPDGVLKPYWIGEDLTEYVYKVTPSEDMVITAKALPKTVALVGMSELTDFSMSSTSEWTVISEDKKSIGFFDAPDVTFRFKPLADKLYDCYYTGYAWDYVYDENGEEIWTKYEAHTPLYCEEDEEGYYVCRLFACDYMPISITINQLDTNIVTFDTTQAVISRVFKCTEDNGDGEIYTYFQNSEEKIEEPVYVAVDGTLYFAVSVQEAGDFASAFVSTDGKETGRLEKVGMDDMENAVYAVTPTEDMIITAKALPKTIPVEGGTDLTDFTVTSQYSSYEVTLAEDKQSVDIWSESNVELRFKPAEDKFYNAYYTYSELVEKIDENGETVIDPETGDAVYELVDIKEYPELVRDEEGYYRCSMYLGTSIKSITIETIDTNLISFDTTKAKIYEVDKWVEDWDDDEPYIRYERGAEIEGTKRVAVGKKFYFAVTVEEAGSLASSFVSTDGTETGRLKSVGTDDSYSNRVYEVTPTEDMTLTVKALPKSVELKYETEPEELTFSRDDGYDLVWNKDAGLLETYEEGTFQLRFKPDQDTAYWVSYTYSEYVEKTDENGEIVIDPETGDYVYELVDFTAQVELADDADGYYNYQMYFYGNLKSINIESAQLYDVKFESRYGYAHAYSDTGEELSTLSLPEGKVFTFQVWMDVDEEVAYLDYVTTTGDESGRIEPKWDADSENYCYTIVPQGDMTVTMADKPSVTAISFDNQSSNMNYTVKTNDNVWFIDDDGSYRANKEAGTFDFTVTVSKENIEPAVTYVDENDKVVSVTYGKKVKVNDESRTYEYSVALNKMPHPAVLTINETEEQYDIAVTYDNKHMASVVAETENGVVTPVALLSSDGQLLFRVQRGDDLTVNMTAKEKCKITRVITTQNDQSVSNTLKASSYSLAVSVIADASVEVKTQMQPEFVMKQIKSDGTKVDLYNLMVSDMNHPTGKFDLAEGKFEGSILDENGNAIVLSEINVQEKYADYIKLSDDKTKISIDTKSFMSKEENPEKQGVKVALTDLNGNLSYVILDLYPDVDKVTSKDGLFGDITNIEVAVDSSKVYAIDIAPLTADPEMIGAEVIMKKGVAEDTISVTLTDQTLCIKTSAADPVEDAATVKLYRKNYLPTDAEYYIEGTEVTISTVKPTALIDGQPDVAVESSDDRTITISVKEPSDVEISNNGKQYYKVVVTPQSQDGKEIPDSILSATANPFYIERDEYFDMEGGKSADSAYRQSITLGVNDCAYGLGQEWKYDIAVSLIQTKDKTAVNAENEAEYVVYRSKETIVSGVGTKKPVFETKLSVKKKNTKIYTTQENVLAGILGYGKSTTNKDVLVRDITTCDDAEKLQVVVSGKNILLSAKSETKLGKHTIEVTPMGPDGMYQTAKTFVVTVEKGIENLELQIPTYRLYKKANKAVTMTVKAVFNPDDTVAKTKKVSWEVLNEAGEPFTETDELYNKITIKNGKITVKKNLNLSGDISFRVKASAADFKGNETCVLSDKITISTVARELETVVLVRKNPQTYYYDVVARNGSKITSDLLSGSEVIAFTKGAPIKDSYTATELSTYALTTSEAGFKSSNKALALHVENGKVKVKPVKTAKNIKITVTTIDGGKKSVSMKLDILHLTPAELGVEMYCAEELLAQTDSKSVNFTGTVNTRVKVVIKQKAELTSDWSSITGFTNHKLTLKNAKVLTSDIEKGVYEIVVTSNKATITLQDKTNRVKKTYELTNSTYSLQKAPKIKVATSLKIAETRKQTIEFTLPVNYDSQNKYVLVELNAVEKAKKNASYSVLEAACEQWGEDIAVQDKKFKLSFEGENIPKGSYKLNVMIGTIAADGTFFAQAKPVNVTIKAAAPKVTKGSFKLKTSYTMKASVGETVSFAYTQKNLKDVMFTELYNINIKGSVNDFTKYFEFSDDKRSLKLKDTLTEDDIAFITSKAAKNHLSGYVTYTASYGDDGYGNPYVQTKTVKITVKFKK